MLDFLKKKPSAPMPTLDKPLKADSPSQAAIKQGLKGVPFEEQVAMLTPPENTSGKPTSPKPVRSTPLGQHTLLGHKHPAAGAAKVQKGDEKNPLNHPLYPVFKARLKELFSEVKPPAGFDLAATGREIWGSLCAGIVTAQPHMDPTTTPDTYVPGTKWVKMQSPGYTEALNALDAVCKQLKSITKTQFYKARSFGLWSKPEGKELAKQNTDLTLETSGIGGLFDDMNQSLDAHGNGWDPHLWGALSRAYAEGVIAAFDKKNKQIHVFAGGGTDKTNIFANIESKAIEKGLHGIRRPLESAVTFHAVAALTPDDRVPDYSVQHGSVPGTWYSGPDWNVALAIGQARWDALNKKAQPEQKDTSGNPIPKGVGPKTGPAQGARAGFQHAQALGDKAKAQALGAHRRLSTP